MEATVLKRKKNVKKQIRKNTNHVPPFVSVKTEAGNIVTMRTIPNEEIKALRNPAYEYLA